MIVWDVDLQSFSSVESTSGLTIESDSHKNISRTVHLEVWTSMGPQDFSGQIGRHAFANTSEVPRLPAASSAEPSGELGGGSKASR